jgi:glutamine synthetase
VRFLRLQFTDIMGVNKNVEVPRSQFEKALDGQIMFDGSSIEGFVRIEESDMLLSPDLNTFRVFPWGAEDGLVARIICDIQNPDGSPFAGCPRSALRRQIARAKKLGFEMMAGCEAEFFLFHKDAEGKPTTLVHDSAGYFDVGPVDRGERARRLIVADLEEMGFEVEAGHHEVAPGQHEIDFKYADALTTADRAMTFKFATKAIALKHGLHASFMAKPIGGINGSGMHTHGSLAKNGKNAFFDANAKDGLSDTCMYYIGGLIKHAKAITRVANPTINSYKRLVPGYEAPCYVSWSTANRSAQIRIPAARGNGTRAEFRSPDPMCNPYLTFACLLAAGLDGIKNKIMPPEATNTNIYHMSAKDRKRMKIEMLPGSLAEAQAAMMKDEVICNALGAHVVETLANIAEAETDAFRLTVHQWELDRYLANY